MRAETSELGVDVPDDVGVGALVDGDGGGRVRAVDDDGAIGHTHLFDGALDAYREAVRLDSDHSSAHHNLAIALQRKGQLEAAITGREG